ncbi:MAG: hypothetical protein HY736_10050 [Verrucomicrobia bacterium]|nr:hypothetical protein [Verrucomicrobiota bacterium]
MKVISKSSKKTSFARIPPLPRALRGSARRVLTVEEARRIVIAHGGRPTTDEEKQKLIAAGLWGMPKE